MVQYEDYLKAARTIQEQTPGFSPDYLLILGSGLGFLTDQMAGAISIPYSNIPGFAQSTAPGHAGRLVLGTLCDRKVVIMQGRLHAYEGYSQEQIAFPVRVAKLLGAHSMIVTNVCGCINPHYAPGELLMLTDFINPKQETPLTGPNRNEFGERFCDMGDVFTKAYQEAARRIAETNNHILREGVYCYYHGPQFETPAEIRSFRSQGADAVGMSTVPECIAAHHAGMKILGISLIANMAAGMSPNPLSEQEVLDKVEEARPHFSSFILDFLTQAP
ncbi:MAG: purine-nucleoside phosphorylase [Saccharofermentanales bacterium]|jgi:purine-nucleoside phosphorylase